MWSILAYDHFRDDKECYRRIAFCDTKTGKEYTDLMEMYILELSKLPPEEKNETSLLQWMRFLWRKNQKGFLKKWQRKILNWKKHMTYWKN